MKRVARLLLVASLICGTASGVWALPGPKEGFVGVVIWVFLAYCALIVVAQLLVALHACAVSSRDRSPKKGFPAR